MPGTPGQHRASTNTSAQNAHAEAAGSSNSGITLLAVSARLLALRALIEALKTEFTTLLDEIGNNAPERDVDDEAAARVAEACRLLGASIPTPNPVEEGEDPHGPLSTPNAADSDEESISLEDFDAMWNCRRRRPHARWLPGQPFPEGEVFWDREQQHDELGMSEDDYHES